MDKVKKAYKDIGLKIEKARKIKGFSQEEVGKKLGYSGAAISYFESGERRISFYDLKRIANILEIPFPMLLGQTLKNDDDLNPWVRNSLNNLPTVESNENDSYQLTNLKNASVSTNNDLNPAFTNVLRTELPDLK